MQMIEFIEAIARIAEKVNIQALIREESEK